MLYKNSKANVLNLVLREKFDFNKLSAVPRVVWETAKRAQKDFKVNIISNGEANKEYRYNENINFIYLTGSHFSFFDNVISCVENQEGVGIVHFFGSLSGGAVFCNKAKKYSGEIILSIINGGMTFMDFKYLRLYDVVFQPFNCIFHPSILGIPFELLFIRSLQEKNVKAVIVQSRRLKKRILHHASGAKVEVVPYGVPGEYLKLKPTEVNGINILYFGHIYTVRGIDDMVRSLHLLDEEGLDFSVKFIVTPETNIKYLEGMLERFPKVKQRTSIIKKYIKDLDVEVQKASLCLFLYRFPGEIPEYPFALLEAMAIGVPVITTDVGAISELFKEGSQNFCLVKPNDIVTIKNRIKMLVASKSRSKKVVDDNRDILDAMTWDKCYINFRKFY